MFRGWFLAPVLIVGLLIAAGIGAAIAHDGWDDDDRGPRVVQVRSPSDSANGTQVIEIHERGWGHLGFFPGFILFPLLFFFLVIWLVGGFFRGGWRGGSGGPWRGHWNDRFEEWHREQHKNDVPPAPPAATA
jgi:hypothetical protein